MTDLSIPATDIPQILQAFYMSGRMPYFVGAPGIGKTALVHEAAREITNALRGANDPCPDVAVIELHLAQMSEQDIRGYLVPTADGRSRFTQPPFAEMVAKSPRGILFLDELPQATHEVQKAAAPLMLDRRIGDYQLPDGWMIAAAGNGTEHNSGANDLLSHVLNRLSLIRVKAPDPDHWIMWGAGAGLAPEFLAFAKIRPDVLFGEPDLSANDEPYCTPRSMHALSDVSKRWPEGITGMVNHKAGLAVIKGFIGEGAMAELRGVINIAQRLPSYEAVVADPDSVRVPDAQNEQYAALMMVAMRAVLADRDAVLRYFMRFNVNFAMVGIIALIQRDTQFSGSSLLPPWIATNRGVIERLSKFIQGR